jgi:hypothetical protein
MLTYCLLMLLSFALCVLGLHWTNLPVESRRFKACPVLFGAAWMLMMYACWTQMHP